MYDIFNAAPSLIEIVVGLYARTCNSDIPLLSNTTDGSKLTNLKKKELIRVVHGAY